MFFFLSLYVWCCCRVFCVLVESSVSFLSFSFGCERCGRWEHEPVEVGARPLLGAPAQRQVAYPFCFHVLYPTWTVLQFVKEQEQKNYHKSSCNSQSLYQETFITHRVLGRSEACILWSWNTETHIHNSRLWRHNRGQLCWCDHSTKRG
jgi:hypothetical protein